MMRHWAPKARGGMFLRHLVRTTPLTPWARRTSDAAGIHHDAALGA
eukprot:CAMPEP_0176317478 /NCGR_PEP_ID=MMETSP0121_2-20121125/69271_1 /TAXON_ID=160619 /ORGANISM="Kryptoperidinium foliaceum, Strain CCMP 1326" /LENGTH=45 /DNA_ID= /DNA_START= /DNA_END= /DNA_ORIENTATION=